MRKARQPRKQGLALNKAEIKQQIIRDTARAEREVNKVSSL